MTNPTEIADRFRKKVNAFEKEAHGILAGHEGSRTSRIHDLTQTRRELTNISLQQDRLLTQSLQCIEAGIYRAACVMAWAGFMDFLEQKIAADGLVKVKSVKTGWQAYTNVEDLRENVSDHGLIQAARDINLISKSEMKSLHGHLSKRNECAHPSSYNPGFNDSLGYVSELLERIKQLSGKSL